MKFKSFIRNIKSRLSQGFSQKHKLEEEEYLASRKLKPEIPKNTQKTVVNEYRDISGD